MGGGSRNGDRVKVVMIETQYVETDAMSFKSVVQNLTGKDSAPPTSRQQPSSFHSGACVSYNITQPVLSRGMSFKDFERMISELPSALD